MMAICVGCGRQHTEFPVYHPAENPVEGDGTYEAGAFACDDCYVRAGCPTGEPWLVQSYVSLTLRGNLDLVPIDSRAKELVLAAWKEAGFATP